MQTFNTPMMKQYREIKKHYQDCLLFFRMGDFYELFLEDAYTGAKVLDITLTSRPKGKDGRIPMAGIPYHAVDSYLSKLVKNGYKVAICEQVSEPNKYGIVEREVVRVVTPGTVLDEKSLERKENNYILSLTIENDLLAFSYADISTGYFATRQIQFQNMTQGIQDELAKISPRECILPEHLYNDPEVLKVLKTEQEINIYPFAEWNIYADEAETQLKKHFQVSTLAAFGLDDASVSLKTAAALLGYLKSTQKNTLSHIKKIVNAASKDYLVLDRSSMINLELFSTIRDHDVKGSLLFVLDQTKTPMGGRLLKSWIKKPLIQKKQIEQRHDAVEELTQDSDFSQNISLLLEQIPDIERTLSRLSLLIGNARDVILLKNSLKAVLFVKDVLKLSRSSLLKQLYKNISSDLSEVINLIEKTIQDEPPFDIKEGGVIKDSIHKELDSLRQTVAGSKDWIQALEISEREKTGISSLKVRFNKVFGFYIEISKANLSLVPEYYIRKQTLVNGERFITPELKKQEEIILTAEEKINALEYSLFMETLSKILEYTEKIQEAASSIAVLDCLNTFSQVALTNDYTRPKFLYSGEMRVTGGRHPVVEKLLDEHQFVPNDLCLDTISQSLLLITGPNMAGKSVFIRQAALIVLMAQIGCFVPAQKAHLSIVDRIFVRSGASDVITSGLSTFMVEMVETAYILHHATKNSLIVMDEIGRGTSTYDGISIAWAVAEYLATHFKTPPKTLFATHYHELQTLEDHYPKKIRNYHMAVADEKGSPIFLHTILPGGASHSFGVAVAKLAGIPDPVIEKAYHILKNMENKDIEISHEPENIFQEPSSDQIVDHLIHKEIESLDISTMTPLDALNRLAELKEKIKLFKQESDTTRAAD
jgi:DNA mismatch repair protein MutS